MYFKILIASMIVAAFHATVTAEFEPLTLRRITFNIRYATTSPDTNERPWSGRRSLLIAQLNQTAANATATSAVLIGLQEVLDAQLNDIKAGLGPAWTHVGVGRDDGVRAGEYSPLLYRPAELRLLHNETAWLSPTPTTPSFGWGAGSRRLVTVAVFEHVPSGRRFLAANTHLDNVSSQARSEGVKVVIDTIKKVQEDWGPLGVTLSGDFNSAPGGDAYKTADSSGYVKDIYTMCNASQRFGLYETYTGFSSSTTATRIDFLWVGPPAENRWAVDKYEVLPNIQNGVYISDHRAVVGDLKLLA